MKKITLSFFLLLLMPLYLGAPAFNIRGKTFGEEDFYFNGQLLRKQYLGSVSLAFFQMPESTLTETDKTAGAEAACAAAAPSNQPQDIKDIQVVTYTGMGFRNSLWPCHYRDMSARKTLERLFNFDFANDNAPNPNPFNTFLASEDNMQKLLDETGVILGDHLILCLPAFQPKSEKAAEALKELSHTHKLSDFMDYLDAAIECENDKAKMYDIFLERGKELLDIKEMIGFRERYCPLLEGTNSFPVLYRKDKFFESMKEFKKELLLRVQNLQNVKQWDCFKNPMPLQEDVINGLVQLQENVINGLFQEEIKSLNGCQKSEGVANKPEEFIDRVTQAEEPQGREEDVQGEESLSELLERIRKS